MAMTTTWKEKIQMIQNRVPEPTEQLCLLSPDELRRMRRLVLRRKKGEAVPCKGPCRDSKEHVAKKDGYIQDAYRVYKTTFPRCEGIHYSCLREKATFPYTEGGAV